LIDIGVNLTSRQFDKDRAAVVARSRAAGVTTLVLTGTSLAGSREAADLMASPQEGAAMGVAMFATAGIHPHHGREATGRWLTDLEELHRRPGIVAVGECGLDFDRNFSPPEDQIRCFEGQLILAAKLRRPVFLHERAAHPTFVEILRRHRSELPAAVVHCFTGSAQELDAYLALDLHIGLTGWICDERRGAHMQEFLGRIPAERLMVETDAPYLLPRNMPPGSTERRNERRNEPAFLPWVVRRLAEARGESPEQTAAFTTATARKFFGI